MIEEEPDIFLTDKSVDSEVPGIISSMKGVVPNVASESITIGVDCDEDVNILGLEEFDVGIFDLNSEIAHQELNVGGSIVAFVRN